jgi:predicted DNA-binding transcriptional regulator YafY
MKIDRLLGIIIYLLNRDVVNTRTLAEKFEVSQRTIQRDVDALNLAGIPVMSMKGTNGGYGIVEGFSMDRQITSSEDYMHIITALKGLCSGYENIKLEATLEKMLALSSSRRDLQQKIHINFGVLKENSNINGCIEFIEKAIETEKAMEFDYTNADNNTSHRIIEPVALTYKWYTWYLFGYCCEKKDYRLFRLSRIRNLEIMDKTFSIKHRSSDELLEEHEKQDNRSYLDIKLRCKTEMKVTAEESFPGAEITQQDNGDIIIRLKVPANERMWFGMLLSLGDKITVLEPEVLKDKLIAKANDILNLYK